MTDTVDVWGLAGFGDGDLTLTQVPSANPAGAQRYTTDISMRMGALGVRGELLAPAGPGGLSVAVQSDAFWVQTESAGVTGRGGGLAASQADASRLRLTVAGSRRFATGGGALTPSLAIGLRHDGGDAETGTGLEAGAALRYAGAGFSVEGAVRVLVAHEQSDYEEWGASGALRIDPGAAGRGLSLSVAPSWGAAASATDRLWSAGDARALAPGHAPAAGGRLDAALGYGLGLPAAAGVLTPFAGVAVADSAGSWRTGAHWAVGERASLVLEGTRREAGGHDGTTAEHGLMLRGQVRW